MPASLKVSANSSGVNGGGGMAARSRGSSGGDRPTVAVVLSGAVARGAFQAGALAELVPALERDGLTPTVWLGTSAGSINAVLWGSAAHRDAATVAEEVLGSLAADERRRRGPTPRAVLALSRRAAVRH